MRRNWKIIIAMVAIVAASVLGLSVPPTWAGPGFVPEPPRPQPLIRCAPDVAAPLIVLVRHGQTYRLYPAKALRLLTPAERARAVPCVWVAS